MAAFVAAGLTYAPSRPTARAHHHPQRCAVPRAAGPDITGELDPGYMFVCRCEGAASAIPRPRLQKRASTPGFANYVTLNAVGNVYIGPPPASIFELAGLQFARNLRAIFGKYDEVTGPLSDEVLANRAKLEKLKLSTKRILEREEARGGIPPETPELIRWPYVKLCEFIDVIFEDRPVIERFFFLETVARMPYFSYVSMLHLYETLGFWRRGAETKRVHGDEEYNEYHHLLIMEALGGDQSWFTRFLAQHAAIAYYWVLVLLFMASPSLGYLFSVLLEGHAVDTCAAATPRRRPRLHGRCAAAPPLPPSHTRHPPLPFPSKALTPRLASLLGRYTEFIESNDEVLKTLPVPVVAREYYNSVGYYLSIGGEVPGFKRSAPFLDQEEPVPGYGDRLQTLGDVFRAIIKDESNHVVTMKAARADDPLLSLWIDSRS